MFCSVSSNSQEARLALRSRPRPDVKRVWQSTCQEALAIAGRRIDIGLDNITRLLFAWRNVQSPEKLCYPAHKMGASSIYPFKWSGSKISWFGIFLPRRSVSPVHLGESCSLWQQYAINDS
jgi:hypothetical protein